MRRSRVLRSCGRYAKDKLPFLISPATFVEKPGLLNELSALDRVHSQRRWRCSRRISKVSTCDRGENRTSPTNRNICNRALNLHCVMVQIGHAYLIYANRTLPPLILTLWHLSKKPHQASVGGAETNVSISRIRSNQPS